MVFSGDGHHCRGRAGCYEDSNFAEIYSSSCEHYYDQDELLLENKVYKREDPLSVYDPSRPRTVRLEGVTTDDSVKTVDVGVQTDPVYLNQFSVHLQKLKIKFISNSYVKMMILHLASRSKFAIYASQFNMLPVIKDAFVERYEKIRIDLIKISEYNYAYLLLMQINASYVY